MLMEGVDIHDVKAMVFAAGLGTRLRPLTDTMPKALVPLCGHPLIWHVLMKLKDAGISDAVVNVHHLADMLEQYLSGNDFGMDISVSDERGCLMETGGGILKAESLLSAWKDPRRRGVPEHMLVHNVDIISDIDLGWFCSVSRKDAMATLLVSGRKTSRYLLFDKDMRLVGWTNVSTGEVRTPFRDLDIRSCRMLAFSGIHLLSSGIFDAFRAEGFSGRFPIMDFYLKAAADYPVYGVCAEGISITDVGKMDSLAQAEAMAGGMLTGR